MNTATLPAGEQAEVAYSAYVEVGEAARAAESARQRLVAAVLTAREHNVANTSIARQLGLTEGAVRAMVKRAQS
ncbi:helix-turn-helix DNA binding domain protein [Arthrobacter phage Sicarius2]|uniref:Helix-turn-helix DNA binding domain protein n=1 Tax=Arthrobacter phage Sicarius2 TaxID=2836090 RepID=A0A8F3E8G1_9CAUD|nr:helix-turn-helix DNA binding domain protein [Arthrobacter phage Sicarius2]